MKKALSSILIASSVIVTAVSTGCYGTRNGDSAYIGQQRLTLDETNDFVINLSENERALLTKELNKAEKSRKRQEAQKQAELQEAKEMHDLEKEKKQAEVEIAKANVGLVKSKTNVNNSVSRSIDTHTNVLIGDKIAAAILFFGALVLIPGAALTYNLFSAKNPV